MWFLNGKMSINSPPCVLDFGAFTWISQDLPLYFKSFHRRLVAESIFVIVPFSSSPILKEPKKAMQLTVHLVDLVDVPMRLGCVGGDGSLCRVWVVSKQCGDQAG